MRLCDVCGRPVDGASFCVTGGHHPPAKPPAKLRETQPAPADVPTPEERAAGVVTARTLPRWAVETASDPNSADYAMAWLIDNGWKLEVEGFEIDVDGADVVRVTVTKGPLSSTIEAKDTAPCQMVCDAATWASDRSGVK